MEELAKKGKAPSLVLDATHPYAAEVTENIKTGLRTMSEAALPCGF